MAHDRGTKAKTLPRAGMVEAWTKMQILTGVVGFGGRLPSPDALAARFEVNVNTVREAYARLAAQEVVDIRHGRGVFVRARVSAERAESIRALLSETLARGRDLDLRADEVAVVLLAFDAEAQSRRLWLADIRHPYIDAFARTLGRQFNASIKVLELDGTMPPPELPGGDDVVFAPIRFVQEARHRFGDAGAKVLPLRVRLDGRGIVELAALPADTRLGCICIEERFARIMGRAIQRQGIDYAQDYAVVDDEPALRRLLATCDAFAISTVARERLREDGAGASQGPLVSLRFEIDPESIEAIKDMMDDPRPAAA